jgi:hypothetical protein
MIPDSYVKRELKDREEKEKDYRKRNKKTKR